MKKNVRLYFTTFVDVEENTDNFSSEKEMVEYVKSNASDFISAQEVYDNLSDEIIDVAVIESEDL